MEHKISHDSETPAHGKQVITACALIHHNFDGVIKVFLPKRADTKKFLPSVFELPGGHIDWGEDIVEGLKREIIEEHGMHIKVGDPFAAFTYSNEVKGSHSVEVVYFATFEDSIENIKLNPEDHSEFKWISQDEIGSIGSISDEEMKNVKKGLALLNGEKPYFAEK
jgi:8-oxo-dGTP diphosphatase